MNPVLYWQQLGLRDPKKLTPLMVQKALAHFAYQYVANTDKKITIFVGFKSN